MEDMQIPRSNISRPVPTAAHSIKAIQSSSVFSSSSIESKDASCLGSIWSSFTSMISSIWNAIRSCFGCAAEKPGNDTGIKDTIDENDIREIIDEQAQYLEDMIKAKQPCFHMLWVENASGERRVVDHKYYGEKARTDDFKEQTARRKIAEMSNGMLEKKAQLIQVRWFWMEFDEFKKQFVLLEYHRALYGKEALVHQGNHVTRCFQHENILKTVDGYFGGRVPPDIKAGLVAFVGKYTQSLSSEKDINLENLEF